MFKLPSWLKRDSLSLPSWAKVRATPENGAVSIVIDVSTDGYVEEWLKLLGVTKITQYWLECAYQCAKLDVQSALVGTRFDPRTAGKPAEFHFDRSEKYRLADYPMGEPLTKENLDKIARSGRGQRGTFTAVDAATKGREARGHYIRIRGQMPF